MNHTAMTAMATPMAAMPTAVMASFLDLTCGLIFHDAHSVSSVTGGYGLRTTADARKSEKQTREGKNDQSFHVIITPDYISNTHRFYMANMKSRYMSNAMVTLTSPCDCKLPRWPYVKKRHLILTMDGLCDQPQSALDKGKFYLSARARSAAILGTVVELPQTTR
jgi:hypothetical protein